MKKSTDFYKVLVAVANALRISCYTGERPVYTVTYVSSKTGAGAFTSNDDIDEVRRRLLQFNYCEEVCDDDVMPGFESKSNDYDIWEFYVGGEDGERMQLAIDPCYYIADSYELRDLIAKEYDLPTAEITEGINGYPKYMRGCVLLNDNRYSFDELEEIAEYFGVELIEVHQKAGWRSIWEERGTAFELFDYEAFLDRHNDYVVIYPDFRAYADALMERAGEIREYEGDEELAERFEAQADEVRDMELGDNLFVYVRTDDMLDYDTARCKTDHFDYDTHYYSLAFDCAIND